MWKTVADSAMALFRARFVRGGTKRDKVTVNSVYKMQVTIQ